MRTILRGFVAMLFALGLVSCGSLGSVDSTAEKIAAAEAAFTAAVESATAAYHEGLIEPGSDLEKAIDLAIEGGNTALNTAHDFYLNGQPETALDWVGRIRNYADEILTLVSKARELVSVNEYDWRVAA